MHNKLRNTNQAYQFECTYSSKSARNLLTKDSISSLTIISKPLSPSYTSLSKDSSLFSLLLPILLDLHLKTPPSSQSLTEYTESTSTLSLIIPDKYTTTDLKYSISLLSTQSLPTDLSPLQLKMSLDLLSEIFNISEDVLTKICSDISLNITTGNCYEYFKLFYIDHICNNNNNNSNSNSNSYRKKQHNACSILGNNVKNSYYHEIILRAVEFAGENLVYYVNESTFGDNVNTNASVNAVNVNANIIKSLPNELIEEIFMQYFMNVQLVKGNNSVVYNSNRNNDKYVIKALMQFRDVYDNDDIFKLLEIEYQKAKMKFISYCANDKPVTFTLNACEPSWESECFYIAGEEYIISLNTLYDESKDEYTIGIKLHNDNNTTITTCPNANTTINATILSLLALVEIPELQYKSKPCSITTVSTNNKSKILLVNIPKFTAALTSKGLNKQSAFTLVFHYDMSYNSSYLLTYIARNFSVNKYPSHPSLQNVDLVLLNTVLAFNELTVYNEDETLTAVITWLNYNQEVALVKKLQLVNKINWNCVSIAKIIEFIMCHSKLITQCEDVRSVINKEIEDRINNALFVYDCSNNEMSTSNINNKTTTATATVNVVNKRKYLSQKNYYYTSTTTNNSNNNSNSHNNIIINSNNNNYDSQNCSCSVIYNGMNYTNVNTKNVKPIIDDIVQGIANVYDNIKETFIANTNINSNSGNNNICNNCNSITNNNNNNAMINMNNHHYTTIASTSNVQKYKNIHHKCNVNSPRGVVPSSFTYDLNHLVQLSTRVYNTNSGHNKSKNIKAQFCSGGNNKQFVHKGSLSPSSVNRNNNNQQVNMYKDGNKSKSLISDRKNNVKNGSAAAVQNVKSKHHYVSKSTGSNHKEGTKTVNANGSGKKLNVSKNYIKNKSPISYHDIAKKTMDGGNNAKSGVICGGNGDKGKGGGVNGNQSNANTISVSSVSVSGNANVNVNNGQHHYTFNTSVKSMI